MIADQHSQLRASIAELEARCAEEQPCSARGLRALRSGLREFVYALFAHLAFEEAVLGPALQGADAWGGVRREALLAEHERQRAVLADLLKASKRRVDDYGLVKTIRDFCADLRADMEREEHGIFSAAVLNDDFIVVEIGA
jgi:hypothetical protein